MVRVKDNPPRIDSVSVANWITMQLLPTIAYHVAKQYQPLQRHPDLFDVEAGWREEWFQ